MALPAAILALVTSGVAMSGSQEVRAVRGIAAAIWFGFG
jgi:hypothetical protein